MTKLLNNTSVSDLDTSIRCSVSTGRPFSLKQLKDSLAAERRYSTPRQGMIKILEREIRRQEKAAGVSS